MIKIRALQLIFIVLLINVAMGGLRINKNMRFVDELNRQITIKGATIIVKVPPYFPKTDAYDPNWSFSDQDIQHWKDIGFNGVRLGAMWAGIEPTKDTYNITYLEQMVKFVNKLGSHGIYTLLDFHQDILSEKFCGDGVPAWLIDEIDGYKTFPIPTTRKKLKLNSSGLPSWGDCNTAHWAVLYFSDDVGRAFNHIYDINHHLHKKFVAYWKTVASYFKDNPYVLAYELMNQPFVGDAARNPFLLLPSVAQRLKFQKFYDSVVSGIREVDNDTNICFEPITFDFAFNTGFSHAPAGRKYANKSILCYHFESPPIKGVPYLKARIRDGKRLGIPVLMSEFGGQQLISEWVEDHLQSNFEWQWKSYGKDFGSPYKPKKDGVYQDEHYVHTRTSLKVTAGNLKKSYFRADTAHFNCVYEATPGGISVLFMSKNHIYKDGYILDMNPKEFLQINERGNYIDIKYIGNQPKLIMITIDRLN